MKNSPHHRKHLQHKAIRAASHIQLGPTKRPKTSIHVTDNLRPLNVKRCMNVLNLYKKHLEQIGFIRIHHGARWSTPEKVANNPLNTHEKNPDKISGHWQSSDMERSKRIARKMLKQNHQHYKKAA